MMMSARARKNLLNLARRPVRAVLLGCSELVILLNYKFTAPFLIILLFTICFHSKNKHFLYQSWHFREKKMFYSKKGIFENRCLNAQAEDKNSLTLGFVYYKIRNVRHLYQIIFLFSICFHNKIKYFLYHSWPFRKKKMFYPKKGSYFNLWKQMSKCANCRWK